MNKLEALRTPWGKWELLPVCKGCDQPKQPHILKIHEPYCLQQKEAIL